MSASKIAARLSLDPFGAASSGRRRTTATHAAQTGAQTAIDIALTTVFGVVVGLSLGLTGGGGSIFAMPMLIYGLGMPPASAVPVSLVAVAMTALVGGVHAIRAELVVWQPAIVFSAGGMLDPKRARLGPGGTRPAR